MAHSEETKRKIAEGVKRYWESIGDDDPRVGRKMSDEAVANMKAADNSGRFEKGKSPHNKGKKASAETRRKLSESHKKYYQTEEGKANIANVHAKTREFYQTEEGKKLRNKIGKRASEFHKGRTNTPEHNSRISKTLREGYKTGRLSLRDLASKFQTGHHQSPKAGRVHYRSSYELECYQQLDQDPEVLSYEVETISIPYVYESIERTYIPDIKVIYIDEDWEVIEIKPDSLTEDPQNAAKFAAARELFGDRFIILTEKELYNE